MFTERAVFLRNCFKAGWNVTRRSSEGDVCATAHFSSQAESSKRASLVQARIKKGQPRKQASETLLFPSVRWSKSWNLRETDCVFEWKGFFSCVVGFFALAADPRVFALRRVGNLGL